MRIFRGLIDLLSGNRKSDTPPPAADAGESPVPVLEKILEVLKDAQPPAEARDPLPAVPRQIQPTTPQRPQEASDEAKPSGWQKFGQWVTGKPDQPEASTPPPTESTITKAASDSGNQSPPVVNVPPANVTVQPTPAPVVNVNVPPAPVQSTVPQSSAPATPQNTPPAPTGTQQPQTKGRNFWQVDGDAFKPKSLGEKAKTSGPESPGDWKQSGAAGGGNFGNVTGGDFKPPEPPEKPRNNAKAIGGGLLDGIGGLTKLAGVVGLVTATFKKTVGVVERFVLNQHAANEELRYYSGSLAVAFANLDIQKLRQNMQLAQNTSGSGSLLADEIRNFKDQSQPLREMSTIMKNKLAANFVASAAAVTKLATDVAKLLGLLGLAEDIEKNTRDRSRDNRTPGVRVAQELASGQWRSFQPPQQLPPIE